MARASHKIGAGMLAALGLSALSPVQQGAALLTAAGVALWASPALADLHLPGVGLVVKKKPGNAPIIVPSDANGEVRLTGLEPGDYDVAPLRLTAATPVRYISVHVGEDGRLAFAVKEGPKGDVGHGRVAAAPGQVASPSPPRWAEAIPFDGAAGTMPVGAVVLDMRQQFTISPPVPCTRPRPGMPSTCAARFRNHVDVNASPVEEMRRLAPTLSAEAAALIIAARTRGGAFRNPQDFANRVCAVTAVNFDDASIKMGNTSITMRRGVDPKSPGWICNPQPGTVDLFASRIATREVQFGFRFQF